MRTPDIPRLKSLLENDRQDIRAMGLDAARIEAIREEFAAAIIAGGMFNQTDPPQDAVIAALVDHNQRHVALKDGIDAFVKRAHDAGIDAAVPTSADGAYTSAADDAALSYALAYGDAGFALGLAVGMQLGPHAFRSDKS